MVRREDGERQREGERGRERQRVRVYSKRCRARHRGREAIWDRAVALALASNPNFRSCVELGVPLNGPIQTVHSICIRRDILIIFNSSQQKFKSYI